MFSVIIAAKNSEKWIKQTIDSLIKQTYKDWECLFSINGSEDSTKDICQSYTIRDNRFSIIEHPYSNKSSALNRAIFLSKNDWICILDSDDIWEPNKLLNQQKFIKDNKNIDIIGTQMQYFDSENNYLPDTPKLPLNNATIVNMLNNNTNPIANSSVCYKKNIHDVIGYYDPQMFGVEDYDMWQRAKRSNLLFHNLDDILMLHRIHVNSNFNSTKNQNNSKQIVDILDKLKRSTMEN